MLDLRALLADPECPNESVAYQHLTSDIASAGKIQDFLNGAGFTNLEVIGGVKILWCCVTLKIRT